MAAVREGLPEGRYGRGADARSDRRLKVIGLVLGVLALGGIGWFGWHSVAGTEVSGEVIKSRAVSEQAVEIHLEVRKDAGTVAVCTLRSVDEDHTEVGRMDVVLRDHRKQIDTVVTMRTTHRGETAELLGCKPADQG
ncbi:DUF4307 domain-containing protein [Streptomyces sp. NPDC006733]|uniref:DUF4307 domain-containing protein n=1 Tax=Streptomyces sp. NPDC006733 TaxID=3155460 RepID=UPI0033D59D05